MFKIGWPDMHGIEVQPADSYEINDTPHMDFYAGQCKSNRFLLAMYI
jgi:hypothetical protein